MGTFFKAIDQEIKFFYPKTRLIIMIIAVLVTILPLPNIIRQLFSLALILSIGLMHGATDHYLYMNAKGLNTKTSIPLAFFIKYLLTLAIMALVWWLSPILAFAIFILTSAYHFGQTQWQYLKITEKSILKKAVYLFWGLLILGLIVTLNAEESDLLINSVLNSTFSVSRFSWLIYASGIILISLMVLLRKETSLRATVFELFELGVITLIALEGDLLLSFGIFFGLWHSLRASQVQIDKLKEDQAFNWKSFAIGSLPFTIISLLGIALLLWASSQLNKEIEPAMLFLIAISVLTMPHMVIYEEFYARHDHKRS